MQEKPVKVVHLITLLEFGGAQGNTIHTVQHLDSKKFDAHLWVGRGAYFDQHILKSISHDRLHFIRFLVRPLNPLFDFFCVITLAVKLLSFKPMILHTHSSKAGILGRVAGKIAGVPVIVHTFHGFGFNDKQKPWTRWLFVNAERLVARWSDKLIFVSKANWQIAKKYGIGDPKKYELIRSGVPLKSLETASNHDIRKELNIPKSAPLVLTIGAFKPQKNLKDFILSAAEIRKQRSDVVFIILGDGELRSELEELRDRLKLTEYVVMPGWREDVASFLVESAVFVMTSLWEGLPRALVEAMALGVPPVCYATDGVLDLLNEQEGTMVPQRDITKLVERVSFLLNNKEARQQLSSSVKSRIGIEFDIDHMVRQQEELYENLLKVDNLRRKH